MSACVVCVNEAVPLRIAVLVVIVLVLFVLANLVHKKIQHKYRRYRALWRDVLRVVSINITFAQINSSLVYVIDVEWPQEWSSFLKYFSFVNIGKANGVVLWRCLGCMKSVDGCCCESSLALFY